MSKISLGSWTETLPKAIAAKADPYVEKKAHIHLAVLIGAVGLILLVTSFVKTNSWFGEPECHMVKNAQADYKVCQPGWDTGIKEGPLAPRK